MNSRDPRQHAFRPDIADETLRGQVETGRFVAGEPYRVGVGRLALNSAASAQSGLGSELIFGESVTVFEVSNGWAWLQNEADRYVGYADAAGLRPGHGAPTHYVQALRTHLYCQPDLKAPVRDVLSMNAAVEVSDFDGAFVGLTDGGWVWAGHLAEAGKFESDHGSVALRFLGTPYLWGGRSSIGLDCSALVQMALLRCGINAPRDSDMQAGSLGEPVPFGGDQSTLQRGDLVFWPGHVGIWLNSSQFVHASAAHMMTVAEPFETTVRRIREGSGDEVTVVRRP